MDEDLYDEFGNLIGAESDSSASEEEALDFETKDAETYVSDDPTATGKNSTALINRETLATAFPEDVEVLVETEDQQSMATPLVEPAQRRDDQTSVYSKESKSTPKAAFNREYLQALLELPERTKNICVLGPLHSGKTSLVDLLVWESHEKIPNISKAIRQGWKPLRYMDNTKLEISRGLSCKLNGLTFLGSDLQDKSVALTVLDTPGHVNFMDEVAVAMSASEACLVVIDVVEGITAVAQEIIDQAQRLAKDLIFVLNKIDRLIIELQLPPKDAYLKIVHVVRQIQKYAGGLHSPELGNVLLASAKLGFTFSIKEFVLYHYQSRIGAGKVQGFIDRLWGNVYFHSGQFSDKPNPKGLTTFAEFVLIPLYKMFTQTLSNDPKEVAAFLKSHFNVELSLKAQQLDPQPLLREVLSLIFRKQRGLIDSIHLFSPSAHVINGMKLDTPRLACPKEAILAHVLKLMDYCGETWALTRIYQGSIKVNDSLKVIDAGTANDEDAPRAKIRAIGLMGGRYVVPVQRACEGQVVLIKGVDEMLTKSGTLASCDGVSFPDIDYINEPTFKIILKALNPRELPLMLEGLNKVNKFYCGMATCVEETGETVVLGTGELYLDCLLCDLRNKYAKVEIQVSNPVVKFAESCVGESFASIPVSGASGQTLTLSVAAQPLEQNLANDLLNGVLTGRETSNMRKLSKLLRDKYEWDSLAARNVWSLQKGNVFVNDTLPDEVDPDLLAGVKEYICQGFEWAAREGPLAEEAIHGVQFRLLSIVAEDGVKQGQLIALARKACYVGLLTAEPALLEPIYEVSIVVRDLLVEIVEEIFAKRRGGRIYNRVKIPATPLMEVWGQVPVIDSVGFETDLRLATNGQAMCQLHFCKKVWRKVPGDVMNENAIIPKLKPAPWESMSRDFVMKIRRRKGLSSDGHVTQDGPSLSRYIDPVLFAKLKENQLV
ncbi:LAME_0G04192g1_1 [Lachancea meyersii CBS 8951]|uniref:LAME_0G04192g1_1 n=1 Tax=Lachancea meyersii CBS 8951 TaxID=1266667 RepID=A0A1G4K6T1_9SACH|nr:LAME_0G04192g1_1 [Lachancea meyersii CBS 8951]